MKQEYDFKSFNAKYYVGKTGKYNLLSLKSPTFNYEEVSRLKKDLIEYYAFGFGSKLGARKQCLDLTCLTEDKFELIKTLSKLEINSIINKVYRMGKMDRCNTLIVCCNSELSNLLKDKNDYCADTINSLDDL